MKTTTPSALLAKLLAESDTLCSMVERVNTKNEVALLAEFGGSLSSVADDCLSQAEQDAFYASFTEFTRLLLRRQDSL